MDKRLSIIIPVYNVEEYVERCILSVVNQPVYPENYELIIVNDGSTDESEAIVKRLSISYPSIQLINQENKGLGAARNTGLDKATGKYVFFIDSDDYISDNSLLSLLNTIFTIKADIILFGLSEIYPGKKKRHINFHLPEKGKLLSVENYINDYTILSSAWQGLFKRSLIEQYQIRMPEGKLAEDDDFSTKIFSVADTLYHLPEEIYNYYQRLQSISNNRNSSHNEKLISDKLEIFNYLIKYSENFSGKRKSGLTRKLDILSLDIIRLLIRKQMPSEIISQTLDSLSQSGYYPLPDKNYNLKYRGFLLLLNTPTKVRFFAFNKFLRRFF